MDFQRLILFVIFAMSGVFLFQAWQRKRTAEAGGADHRTGRRRQRCAGRAGCSHQRHGSVPTAAPSRCQRRCTVCCQRSCTGGDATNGKCSPSRPISSRRSINTLGGVIEEVALKEHRDAADKSKPYLVLKEQDRTHVAQSGLIGAGLPNPRFTARSAATPILAAPSHSRFAFLRRSPAAAKPIWSTPSSAAATWWT